MKRNRTKMEITDTVFDSPVGPDFQLKSDSELPQGIIQFAFDKFRWELDNLFYPELYVLPITENGELYRDFLYNELEIDRYGSHERNMMFGEIPYLVILVNND